MSYLGQPGVVQGTNLGAYNAVNPPVINQVMPNLGNLNVRPPMSQNMAGVPGAVSYPALLSQASQAVGLAPSP